MGVPLRTAKKAEARAAGSQAKVNRAKLIRNSVAKYGLTNTFAINKEMYDRASNIASAQGADNAYTRGVSSVNEVSESEGMDIGTTAIGMTNELLSGGSSVYAGVREMRNVTESAANETAGNVLGDIGAAMDILSVGQSTVAMLDTFNNAEATTRDKGNSIAETAASVGKAATSTTFAVLSHTGSLAGGLSGIGPCITGSIDLIMGTVKVTQATMDKCRLNKAKADLASEEGISQLKAYADFASSTAGAGNDPHTMISALAEEQKNAPDNDKPKFDAAIRGIMRMMQINPTVAMAKRLKGTEQFQGAIDCISGACSILFGALEIAGAVAAGVGTIVAAACQTFISTVLSLTSFIGTRIKTARDAKKSANSDISQIFSIRSQVMKNRADRGAGSGQSAAPADDLGGVTDIDSLTTKIINDNQGADTDYNTFSLGKKRSYMSKICYEMGSVERSPAGLANNLAINRAAQIRIYANMENPSGSIPKKGPYPTYTQMLYGMGILKTGPNAKLPSVETIAGKLGFNSSLDVSKLIKAQSAADMEETQLFYTDDIDQTSTAQGGAASSTAPAKDAAANQALKASSQRVLLMRNQADEQYRSPSVTPAPAAATP